MSRMHQFQEDYQNQKYRIDQIAQEAVQDQLKVIKI